MLGVASVASLEDVGSVGESGSGAGQDVGACANHVLGEGVLLAVEDEDISVFVELSLRSSASSLASLDSALLVGDFFVVLVNSVIVASDAFIVLTDVFVVL